MVDPTDHRSSGMSLIGTVMVLVILGVMAAITVKMVSSTGGLSSPLGGVATSLPSGGPGGSTGAASHSNTTTAKVSLVGEAAIRACEADVTSIQTALSVAEAAGSPAPTTVDGLVQGGWLQSAPSLAGYQFSLETQAGAATGRVLVNGMPSAQGCRAPTP